MAYTNFSRLTSEQKTIWAMDLWKAARNYSFIGKFLGTGTNSVIQHVTDLKKSEKGARAVITLLADLEGDGRTGDRQLKGFEEAMRSYDQVIRIDQLRHANSHEGRMAEQKSIISFRENSRDVLAYWLAERLDQLAFQTLSGVAYTLKPDLTTRVGSDLANLEFAADVSAPSTLRRLRWDVTTVNSLISSAATTGVEVADQPSWEMLVQLKAYAKDQYVRPVSGEGGEELYHVFMTPQCMAKLKMETNFIQNVRHAYDMGKGNPLFTGSSIKVDGLAIHEYRNVIHGTTWGGGGAVAGCQVLLCGSQALAMADLGAPYWDEEEDDFGNRQSISVGKIFGFLKPKFYSQVSGTTQDFGVVSCYCAH